MRTKSTLIEYGYLDRDNNPKTVMVSRYTVYHWDMKRGKDSLAEFLHDLETCQTMTEIGEKWGITRERVRQLLLKIHDEKGRTRQRVCTISRRAMNTKYTETSLWMLDRIQKQGFIVKACLTKQFFPRKQQVSINHKQWRLWYAENISYPTPGQKSSYTHIGGGGFNCKNQNKLITRYNHVTKERELFVIPKGVAPAWGMFIPFVRSDYHNAKNKWFEFKDAWEHL